MINDLPDYRTGTFEDTGVLIDVMNRPFNQETCEWFKKHSSYINKDNTHRSKESVEKECDEIAILGVNKENCIRYVTECTGVTPKDKGSSDNSLIFLGITAVAIAVGYVLVSKK